MYSSNITQNTSQISLPNPVPGVYLYKIISIKGTTVGEGKFVIE
jgi:hypothetical protein